MRRSSRRSHDAPPAVTVERIGGCFLLRSADERASDVVDELRPPPEYAVVVAAVRDDLAAAMWPRLAEVLAQVRSESRQVVLALSDAGRGTADEAALARRIADAWKLTVVAPAGEVLLMPGGMLFAHATDGDAQWWSFAPDAEPAPLGPRWPVPAWNIGGPDALGTSPDGPASADAAASRGGPGVTGTAIPAGAGAPRGRSALTAVPAGLLVQPGGTPPPAPGDLAYAIPAVPDRPSVLVEAGVTAADLVSALSLLTARPEWRRHPLRLVPTGARDLLPLGQVVARDLEVDVEVLTGLPVRVARASKDAPPGVVLLDEAGQVTWTPFVYSVLCGRPDPGAATPPPRPVTWRPPAAGMRVVDAARGVLWLGESWRVAVTRAGLWAYPADADPATFPDHVTAAWPATAGTIRVDVGTPDRSVDDEVWPRLADLLTTLPRGTRTRTHIVVHGMVTPEGEATVRSLAARHDAEVELVQPPAADEPPPPARTLLPPLPSPSAQVSPPAALGSSEPTTAPPDVPPDPSAAFISPESEPATSRPTESEPVEQEPVWSEPVGPVSVEPEPVASEPVEPEPVEPEPVEPEPVEPEPVEPEPAEPEPAEPEPAEAEPAEAEPVEPAGTSASKQDVPAAVAMDSAPIAEPGRRSTESERLAFRAMAGPDWEAYAAPLRHVFSRLPAIGADERAAATVDFVAVRLYLMRPDDRFGPAAVRSGGESLRPYLVCLASGLDRLPTYRGAVVRGADAPVPADAVGTVLTEPGPVGGLPLNAAYKPGLPPSSTVQVIWSETARRVAALFDAESEETRRGDVVFASGSRFAVLDVRPGDADNPDLVLLREVPPTTERTPPSSRLVVTKLELATDSMRPPTDTTPPSWPAHCLGPIGLPPSPAGD